MPSKGECFFPLHRQVFVRDLAKEISVNTSHVRRGLGIRCPHPLTHVPSGWGSDPPPPPIPPGLSTDLRRTKSHIKGEFRSGYVKDLGHPVSSEPPQSLDCKRLFGSVGQQCAPDHGSGGYPLLLRRRLFRSACRSSAAMSQTPKPVMGFRSPRRIKVRKVEVGIPVNAEASRSR